MIDIVGPAATSDQFSWGPLIVGLLVAMFAGLIGFGGWIVRSINQLGKDDILTGKKAHDELMDTKLATAILNEKNNSLDARVTILESYHDATLQPKGNP
jgi:hypothetical protein